jgi:hypothetical protein
MEQKLCAWIRLSHHLKREVNAKQATKEAEQQAKDDLKGIAG